MSPNVTQTKTCSKCNEEKALSCYYKKKGEELRPDCKECFDKLVKGSRKKVRKKKLRRVQEIKSENGCIHCGERHPACLHFHHTEPDRKVESVATLVSKRRSDKLINDEIEKCVILCANCHAKLHWKEKQQQDFNFDNSLWSH